MLSDKELSKVVGGLSSSVINALRSAGQFLYDIGYALGVGLKSLLKTC